MGKMFRVVGACAQVPTTTQAGATIVTLYQGAVLPGDVDPARLRHLLDVGLVEEVADLDAPYPAGVDTPSQIASVGGQPVVSGVDSATEARRAAAREKLPADGAVPKATHGEDVWVEYAVTQGVDRGEAERLGKGELMRRFKAGAQAQGDDAELKSLRERAVKQGMSRTEVDKASADELRALVK